MLLNYLKFLKINLKIKILLKKFSSVEGLWILNEFYNHPQKITVQITNGGRSTTWFKSTGKGLDTKGSAISLALNDS